MSVCVHECMSVCVCVRVRVRHITNWHAVVAPDSKERRSRKTHAGIAAKQIALRSSRIALGPWGVAGMSVAGAMYVAR